VCCSTGRGRLKKRWERRSLSEPPLTPGVAGGQVGVELGDGGRARRAVLRRFSDFRTLHESLAGAWGGVRVPPPPQKNSLQWLHVSPALIEERRLALQVPRGAGGALALRRLELCPPLRAESNK
jgi:hypothetical protein